jgi:hypothetical protein
LTAKFAEIIAAENVRSRTMVMISLEKLYHIEPFAKRAYSRTAQEKEPRFEATARSYHQAGSSTAFLN